MDVLHDFLASQAGTVLQGMLVIAFADFLTGVFAAIRDGTFALDALAAFIRKHIVGRVLGIAALLTLGYFGGGIASTVFMAGAIAAASAYTLETAASVFGNLNPPKEGDVKTGTLSNPIPED